MGFRKPKVPQAPPKLASAQLGPDMEDVAQTPRKTLGNFPPLDLKDMDYDTRSVIGRQEAAERARTSFAKAIITDTITKARKASTERLSEPILKTVMEDLLNRANNPTTPRDLAAIISDIAQRGKSSKFISIATERGLPAGLLRGNKQTVPAINPGKMVDPEAAESSISGNISPSDLPSPILSKQKRSGKLHTPVEVKLISLINNINAQSPAHTQETAQTYATTPQKAHGSTLTKDYGVDEEGHSRMMAEKQLIDRVSRDPQELSFLQAISKKLGTGMRGNEYVPMVSGQDHDLIIRIPSHGMEFKHTRQHQDPYGRTIPASVYSSVDSYLPIPRSTLPGQPQKEQEYHHYRRGLSQTPEEFLNS
jgi:hypothetical protein